MTLYIYAYKNSSEGARSLRDATGAKLIRHHGSRYKRGGNLVLNWGASSIQNEEVLHSDFLNLPGVVSRVSNKLSFFRAYGAVEGDKGFSAPEYSESREDVLSWLHGGAVCCRTVLNGHSGEGLVLATTEEEVVDAPLYTKYVPKTYEFRVHVFDGKVIDVQRKARRKDVPDDQVNWQIRNHQNGFIYAREGFEAPQNVLDQSVTAVNFYGLDFGAVDVIYGVNHGAYVIEINTAPGITGTTVLKYAEAIKEYQACA